MKVRTILSSLLFCIHLGLFCQIFPEINKISSDSLKQILPEMKGEARIDALNQLAFAISWKKPDSSLLIAGETLKISAETDYQKGMADAYFAMGVAYSNLDSFKLSILSNLAALRKYEQLMPDIWMGMTLFNLSQLSWMAGRTEKAIEYCKKRIELYDRIEVPMSYTWDALIQLAMYHEEINGYDSIYTYCAKAYEISRIHRDTNYMIFSQTNLFEFMLRHSINDGGNKERLDTAIKVGLRVLNSENLLDWDPVSHSIWLMFMNTKLAEAYMEMGSAEATRIAYGYLDKAKSIYENITFNYTDVILIYRLYAKLESRKGNYLSAIGYYEKGLAEYQDVIVNRLAKYNVKIDRSDRTIKLGTDRKLNLTNIFWVYRQKKILQEVYDSLYSDYATTGNVDKALEYHILKDDIEHEIFKEEYRNVIVALEAESENENIRSQFIMLEKDKQLHELRADRARKGMISTGIIFVIIVIMGFVFIRQNKLKNEFRSTILEQKLLRLQMNPHFLFNALSNIHNLLESKQIKKASTYLVNFSQLLRGSLESSREDYILLEEEIGILRNYLEIQRLRYDYKFDFSIGAAKEVESGNAIIPPMLIQPFIENAIEHGIKHKNGHGRITIRFLLVKNKLVCEVDDDGIGRKKAWEMDYTRNRKHKSMATDIISDRIKILNKKFRQKIILEIIDKYSDSKAPCGTTVRLELPYLLD